MGLPGKSHRPSFSAVLKGLSSTLLSVPGRSGSCLDESVSGTGSEGRTLHLSVFFFPEETGPSSALSRFRVSLSSLLGLLLNPHVGVETGLRSQRPTPPSGPHLLREMVDTPKAEPPTRFVP